MKLHFEKVPIGKNESLRMQRNVLPYFDAPWHYHPECELALIEEGWGKRYVCDSIEHFGPGDLVLLGSLAPHFWKSDDAFYEEQPELRAVAIVIQFSEHAFGRDFLQLPEMASLRHLLQRAQRGIRFGGATRQQVSERVQQLLQADPPRRLIGLLDVLDLLARSADGVALGSPGFMGQLHPSDFEKVNKVYAYVLQHFRQELPLEAVAGVAGLTKAAFCRYFKGKTKKTFSQFLNEIRISHACHLLIEGKLSVSQVGYECGFQSPAYFNKQFKAIRRQTPLQYQRQYRPGAV
jgi:AraC-like DNA-binding protein